MGLCYTELMIDSLYSTQSIPKRAVVSNTQLSSCFTQCLVFIQYIPLCVLETENERLTTALRGNIYENTCIHVCTLHIYVLVHVYVLYIYM